MSRINDFLRKMNPVLKELICGIFLWGLAIALVSVWFASSRISFVLSLAAGALAAAGMAFHMYLFIEDSLELGQDDAVRHMRKGTVLRTLAALALFVLTWRLHGSILGMFLGMLTLKLGAYSQPLIHRAAETLCRRFRGFKDDMKKN